MLHDVGKLVIARHVNVGLLYSAKARGLVFALMRELHSRLGVLVSDVWQLGPDVTSTIAYHHDPEVAPAEAQRNAWLLRASDIATHRVEAELQHRTFKKSDALDRAPANLHAGKDPLQSARVGFHELRNFIA
jgi:HD-like signal output (HDOD) protein